MLSIGKKCPVFKTARYEYNTRQFFLKCFYVFVGISYQAFLNNLSIPLS